MLGVQDRSEGLTIEEQWQRTDRVNMCHVISRDDRDDEDYHKSYFCAQDCCCDGDGVDVQFQLLILGNSALDVIELCF